VALGGVGAQGGPQLGHDGGGGDPVPDHVADGDRDTALRELEEVVPVAAEAAALGRDVARRDLEPGDAGQLGGQQRALERLGHPALLEQLGVLDRRRRAVGGELEQLLVLRGELAEGEGADVQYADHAALDQQRDAEQRLDALLAQDRVVDVGVVDVGDEDRPPVGRDAAGEAAPEGDRHALLDLLLDALGGARPQPLAVRLEQEDGGGVAVQRGGHALEQLRQQLILGQVGERGVGDPLERFEPQARVALLGEQVRVVDGQGGAVGGELQQLAVLGREVARGQAADMQDAERPAADDERDPEQGSDALLAQDRVEDVAVVDVGDGDRLPLGHDAAREAAADRQPGAFRDLSLEALGRARVQHVALGLEQQDRRGVAVEDLDDPVEERGEQLVLGQVSQRGVGHPL
jgi:hypothetical protein